MDHRISAKKKSDISQYISETDENVLLRTHLFNERYSD